MLALGNEESDLLNPRDTVETENKPNTTATESLNVDDGKMRIDLERSNLKERFPNSTLESNIEIYYSDRVPQEMLDETILLINSTTNSKVISQIFLDTEYNPKLDPSDKAYSFERNVMYIVKWDDDPEYPMFNRYFYHELGHLLLGEYMHINGLASEDEIPLKEDWVYYFCPDSFSEDFAKMYEYYKVWPGILDTYVEFFGIGPSVAIMKELITTFE